MFALDWLQKHK